MSEAEHAAKTLAEAKSLLAKGNETDHLLFTRAGRYLESSFETESRSVNGIPYKRRRLDVVSDRAIGDELTMILSWRLGLTPSFWWHASLAGHRAEEAASRTEREAKWANQKTGG